MNNQPFIPPEVPDEKAEAWETAVHDTARHFNYPPTPDIAGAVRGRLYTTRRPTQNWRLAATALVALLVFSMAVPEVRAFVVNVLRIGVVSIFSIEPSATPTFTLTPIAPTLTGRPTAIPTAIPIDSALELPGETTLSDAEAHLAQAISLPTYPPELGEPNHVYVDDMMGMVVTLVWTQPDDATQVRMVIQILNPNAMAVKYYPWGSDNEQQTLVNGRPAVWLTAVHQIFFYLPEGQMSRIIDRNVLIWEEGDLTYRLETDLTLREAVRIAESLE